MKKQGKAKTKAGAGVKPDAAKAQAAKVKADKPAKPARGKAAKVAAVADDLTERELLREIVKGLRVVADRVESVRRTLWRMSEIREYESKGAKGKPETAQDRPDAGLGGEK